MCIQDTNESACPRFSDISFKELTLIDRFNLTAHLQHELQTGSLNVTLSDLNWGPDIQTGLNSANGYLEVAFVLYIFSIIFLLSTIIPSATMVFLTTTYASLSPKICLLSAVSQGLYSNLAAEPSTDRFIDNILPCPLICCYNYDLLSQGNIDTQFLRQPNRHIRVSRPPFPRDVLHERRAHRTNMSPLGTRDICKNQGRSKGADDLASRAL